MQWCTRGESSQFTEVLLVTRTRKQRRETVACHHSPGFLKEGEGMNVVTGKFADMVEAGIVDPVLVTKSALKNAVSVVSTIISADCVISNARADESNQ